MKPLPVKSLGRILLTFIFAFISSNAYTQITPGGYLDTVLDNSGNKIPLTNLIVNDTLRARFGTNSTIQPLTVYNCGSNYFELYFENGWEGNTANESARRSVICRVVHDLSLFINSPLTGTNEKVRIWVKYHSNMPDPVPFAAAVPFYALPYNSSISGIADNVMWTTIVRGLDAYTNVAPPIYTSMGSSSGSTFFHGLISVNFDNNSFVHTLFNPSFSSSSEHDLYTVVLHEMLHALGFHSLIAATGSSQLSSNFPYYDRYDTKLKTQSGIPLITNSGTCSMYNWSFTASPSVLQPNSSNTTTPDIPTCSAVLEYEAGVTDYKVYTPDAWVQGSSLSHLEDACPPLSQNNLYYVMSNASPGGSNSMKRHPTAEERKVLCDLGYDVNTGYGNNTVVTGSAFSYTGSCPGIQVAGINDGISGGTYTFQTTAGNPVTWASADFLDNDHPSTSGFECLQDITLGTAGSFTATSGTTTTSVSYTPPAGSSGVRLLRYVPTNGSNKGNITYIYVYVISGNCTPTACDMISNGNCESSTSCWMIQGIVDCWDNFMGSPDLYSPSTSCGISDYYNPNSYISSPPTTSHPPTTLGNNHFIGMWANSLWGEGGQTTLISPITAGITYTISFWAKTGNLWTNSDAELLVGGTPNLVVANNGNFVQPGVTSFTSSSVIVPNNNQWNYITLTYTHPLGSPDLNNFFITNAGCMYFNNCVSTNYSVVVIDDVSVKPQSAACSFNLPTNIDICESITDLEDYVSVPGGTFTGSGVVINGGNYDFLGAITGTGLQTIAYTYTDNNGCMQTVYAQVTVDPGCNPCPSLGNIEYIQIGFSSSGPGTLNSNLSAGNYYIANDVEISGNLTFTDAKILLAPGVTINILPTSKLELKSCHLFSCTGMWNGVVLQNNGSNTGRLDLSTNGTYTSGARGTLIEDALIGVDIPQTVNTSATNVIFKSTNACFNRNEKSVRIANCTSNNVPNWFRIDNTIFTSRDLSAYSTLYPEVWPSNQTLKAYHVATSFQPEDNVYFYTSQNCKNNNPALMGIQLESVGPTNGTTYSQIVIGKQAISTSDEEFNIFDNHRYGIYAEASNFDCINGTFMYLNSDNNGTGGTGIYCRPLGTSPITDKKVRVYEPGNNGTGNSFYNCVRGVESVGYKVFEGSKSMMIAEHSGNLGLFGYRVTSPNYTSIDINDNVIYNLSTGIYVGANFYIPQQFSGPSQFVGTMNVNRNTIKLHPNGGTNQWVNWGIYLERTLLNYVNSTPTGIISNNNNTLTNVYNGIMHRNFRQDAHCLDNTITLKNNNPNSQYGIKQENTMNDRTGRNMVTGFGLSNGGNAIAINSVGAGRHYLSCNQVFETNIGFEFQGANSYTQWKENDMTNNGWSYVVRGANTKLGPQIGKFDPCRNRWLAQNGFTYGTTNGHYQTLTVGNPNPTQSRLWVNNNSNENPIFNMSSPITTPAYGSNSISVVIASVPDLCPPQPKKSVEHLSFPVQVASNLVSYGTDQVIGSWIAQKVLWECLQSDTTLIDTFIALHEFTNMARTGRIGMIARLDSLLAEEDTAGVRGLLNDSALLAPKYDSNYNGVVVTDDSTVNRVIDNYRKYYDLYLRYMGDTLAPADTALVDSLAGLCPFTDGYAVFQARALANLIHEDVLTFISDCEGPIDTSSRPVTENYGQKPMEILAAGAQDYILLPNPNNGTFIIKQAGKDERPVTVEIMNVLGVKLFMDKVKFINGKAELRMNGVVPGNYLLKLIDNDGRLYNLKFVVL